MTVWENMSVIADITASTGTPGAEPLEVDVYVSPGFSNRVRLCAVNGETDIELQFSPENAARLIEAFHRGNVALATHPSNFSDGSALDAAAPEQKEDSACAGA